MATPGVMKLLEEKNVDKGISHFVWSPKMDIIAVASEQNDTSLYRLNFQKVSHETGPNFQKIWTTESSDVSISALAWRPDGKVLAVAYKDGKIELFDVENRVPVLGINSIKEEISFMRWFSCAESEVYQQTNDSNNSYNYSSEWEFLTKFPSLSKAFSYNPSKQEDIQTCRKLCHEVGPSILICGTTKGSIYSFMAGHLPIGWVNVSSLLNQECTIRDVILSPMKLSSMVVLATPKDDEDGNVIISTIKWPILSSCFSELCLLAETNCILLGTLDYMSDTLKQISEAWESILLEMDQKLNSYSQKMPDEHGMAADFMELLLLGTPSSDLEDFLLRELGEKGLKKLGHSIESSYSNIQRLVLKYLHTVSQALTFHLSENVGQIKASDKYESVLKITVDSVSKALKDAAAFWAKGIELQQVIDETMKCFKAFLQWMYIEILRLSDDNVSEDLNKASQQDVEFIAQFLESFSQDNAGDDAHTYLEKVGQYLKDEPLVKPVDRSKNPWHNFLEEHPNIGSDIPEILVIDNQASLIQTFKTLSNSIEEIFESMNCEYTTNCLPTGTWRISCSLGNTQCSFSQIEHSIESKVKSDKTYSIILWSGPNQEVTKALFVEFDNDRVKDQTRGLWLDSTDQLGDGTQFHIVGVSFYTGDSVSLLTGSADGQRLIQMPISHLEPFLSNFKDGDSEMSLGDGSLSNQNIINLAGPACHRELEGLNAESFAMSVRKVAAFLFKNRKRIRIYDMEIEEEDDDEGETLGNSGLSDPNTSF